MEKTFISFIFLFLFLAKFSYSLPLSTKSRWIVDDLNGNRVKLTCVNWPAHLKPMLAEGLDKKPVDYIMGRAFDVKFNCVRLTWATHMFTRYSQKTVMQSFQDLNLTKAIKGLKKNNPQFLNLTVVDAFSAMIDVIGSHRRMVVLDNHVSKPMWCCGRDDGNGFFGDKYFDPKEWLRGLSIVGKRYKNTHNVVAMSLRNELRGPRQNVTEWYKWVRRGAKAIHNANSDLLILISSLHYGIDFSQLKTEPLGLDNTIPNKIVYETHRYSFTEGQAKQWLHQPVNEVCNNVIREINKKTGFLTTGPHAAPLFITEFGVDVRGKNRADNLFLTCYMTYLAEMDLDWALWALQGSYYLREGVQNMDEVYGLFDNDWAEIRNLSFTWRLKLISLQLQEPKSKSGNFTFLHHPLTGGCVFYDEKGDIFVEDCWGLIGWSHAGDGAPIMLSNTSSCVTAVGDGLPVKLTTNCHAKQSRWRSLPNSRFQFAYTDEKGVHLCLDYDTSSDFVTRKCICAGDDASECHQNPQSQWFQFVYSNHVFQPSKF